MRRLMVYFVVLFLTIGVGVIFPFVFGTDRFYTHFFYVPIALTAIWFPKYAAWIGAGFAVEHMFIEWISSGECSVFVVLRSLVILIVSFLLSHIYQLEKYYSKKIEKLSYTNEHDEMTGVYNRFFFDEHLKRELVSPIAVLICDIDNLKEMNDRYGHDIGDLFIIKMAKTLERFLPEEAFCARIGGDEFCVLFKNVAEEIVKKYIDQLKGSVEVVQFSGVDRILNDLKEIELCFSVGYSFSQTEHDIFSMLREADQRMYAEKYEHKTRKVFI